MCLTAVKDSLQWQGDAADTTGQALSYLRIKDLSFSIQHLSFSALSAQ